MTTDMNAVPLAQGADGRQYTFPDLVSAYVTLRDQRRQLKEDYEAADNKLKMQMETCGNLMLAHLQKSGAENMRTGYGTASILRSRKYQCADRPGFRQWVQDTNNVDALEMRVSESFMKELEATGAALPPGIVGTDIINIGVRRA
jgi:hypothetical protein